MQKMSAELAKRWVEVTGRIMGRRETVEVIRCRNCKWYNNGYCRLNRIHMTDNGFCDKGATDD